MSSDKKKINEIRLRNVDAAAIAKLDALAQKKGITRNKLIKSLIEQAAVSSEISELEEKYNLLVKQCLSVIAQNSQELAAIRAMKEERSYE